MRLNKKLLATLLPITAASALAPVLSSCNKGNGYVINYGDKVDCLNEKATGYHSINDVKNSVKSHTSPETRSTISSLELPSWEDGAMVQQMMYYDLIASHSLVDEKEQVKFVLTWTVANDQLTIKFDTTDGNKIDGVSTIEYAADATTSTQIDLKITCGEKSYSIKSYNFKDTKLVE